MKQSRIAHLASVSALLAGFSIAGAAGLPMAAHAQCLQQTMDAQAAAGGKNAVPMPPVAPEATEPPQPDIDAANWAAYKCRFILDTGRVVDTANNGVSHSEGQAWGMLLAESRNDRPEFERIWGWTQKNLMVRPDSLFAWRWLPNAKKAIADKNDASDGDIMIAWALEKASRRWPDGPFKAAGQKIAKDINKRLIRKVDGKLVLLPGVGGFYGKRETTLNLSYYVFPAFASLNMLAPSPQWADMRRDGLKILADAQFGRWKLPPDWLTLKNGKLQIAADHPKRYSWDAIRIPLYLIWSGEKTPAELKPYLTFLLELGALPFQPAWTNLDDDSIASYGMSAGPLAVSALVKTVSGVNKNFDRDALPKDQDYYSSSLFLLTRLAALESGVIPAH